MVEFVAMKEQIKNFEVQVDLLGPKQSINTKDADIQTENAPHMQSDRSKGTDEASAQPPQSEERHVEDMPRVTKIGKYI